MQCNRCGKDQTAYSYCVQWKDNDCITMGAVIVPKKDLDIELLKKTKVFASSGDAERSVAK